IVHIFESAYAPTPTPSPSPTPLPVTAFSLSPVSATFATGQTIQVTISGSTDGSSKTRARVALQYDPAIFQVQGSVAIASGSPFKYYSSSPVYGTGQVT